MSKVSRALRAARLVVLTLSVALFLGVQNVFAQTSGGGGSLLPDIGVEMTDYIEEGGTEAGVVLGAVVGLAFVVFLIWRGVRWFKRAAA